MYVWRVEAFCLTSPVYYKDYPAAFQHFLEIQNSVEYEFEAEYYESHVEGIVAQTKEKIRGRERLIHYRVAVERIEVREEPP